MRKKKLQANIAILREITEEENKPRLARSVRKALEEKPTKKKDLGRLGGLKSVRARMKKPSAKTQTETARRSSQDRWKHS